MNASSTSNYYSFIQPTDNPPLHSYDKDWLNTMMTMIYNIDRINYVIIDFENKLREETVRLKSIIQAQ
jgi:inhibitor of KinA sporulation pathway (predicted exonuclease)